VVALSGGDPTRACTDGLLWATAFGYVLQILFEPGLQAMGAKVRPARY
jgi:uridine nucleosidase